MVRGDLTGDANAMLLGEAHLCERRFRGEMSNVEAGSGKFRDLHVAGDTNRFGGRGHAWQTETSRSNAFAHNRTSSQGNIFGMLDYGKIEGATIVHDLASEFGGGDGLTIVGHSNDAGVAHGGNISDGFTFTGDAGGADGPDTHVAEGFGAIHDKAGDGGIVINGLGIGHATDGGETSASSGVRAGFDGFGVFLAGLAKVGVHINETRGDDQTGGVEDLRAVGVSNFSGGSDFGNALAIEKKIAGRIGFGGGVEDATVLNQKHEQIPWVQRFYLQELGARLLTGRASGDRE